MTTATTELTVVGTTIEEFDGMIAVIETELAGLVAEQANLVAQGLTAAESGDGSALTLIGHRKGEIPIEIRSAKVRLLTVQAARQRAKLPAAIAEAKRATVVFQEADTAHKEAQLARVAAQRDVSHATVKVRSIREKAQAFGLERAELTAELAGPRPRPNLWRSQGLAE